MSEPELEPFETELKRQYERKLDQYSDVISKHDLAQMKAYVNWLEQNLRTKAERLAREN